MVSQLDRVTVEDAYAEALKEIAQLQERVIHGRALIASLKREVSNGRQSESDTGNGSPSHSAHGFSD